MQAVLIIWQYYLSFYLFNYYFIKNGNRSSAITLHLVLTGSIFLGSAASQKKGRVISE